MPGDARELGDVRPHVVGAERAVDADRRAGRRALIELKNASTVWPDSVRPERSGIVTDAITGTRRTPCVEQLVERVQRRLAVERVDVGLGQQQIDAALDQRARLLARTPSTSSRNVTDARARIVDVGRQRRGLRRRADRAGDPARLAVVARSRGRRRGARPARRRR